MLIDHFSQLLGYLEVSYLWRNNTHMKNFKSWSAYYILVVFSPITDPLIKNILNW